MIQSAAAADSKVTEEDVNRACRNNHEDVLRFANKNQLENLKTSGECRCLCTFEHRGSRCVTSHRFAALQELDEDKEVSVGTITRPGLTVGDFIAVKPKYQKKAQGRRVNQQTSLGDFKIWRSTPCTTRATRTS